MFERIVRNIWKRLAMLGLIVTEESEPRVPDAERVWGTPHQGLALSLSAIKAEDEGIAPDLSIALKNLESTDRTLHIADWMAFYEIRIDAPLSDYGELLRSSAAKKPAQQVKIFAGKFVETDIPLDRLYRVVRGRRYRITASCALGLQSNAVEIVA